LHDDLVEQELRVALKTLAQRIRFLEGQIADTPAIVMAGYVRNARGVASRFWADLGRLGLLMSIPTERERDGGCVRAIRP
jgi:hypothetical protein